MKKLYFSFFILFPFCAAAQSAGDTFSVYFDLDKTDLNEAAKSRIDSLFYFDKIFRGASVSIKGYADFLSNEAYNLGISAKRAESVSNYLMDFGIYEKDIKLLVGKGEVKRRDTVGKSKGIPQDRRVDIIIETPMKETVKRNTYSPKKTLRTNISIPPSSSDPDFDINQIEEGQSFILKNIYFPMGRHFPKQTSYKDLDMILESMRQNPRMKIRVEGHVCCIVNVSDAYDLDSRRLDLSVNRARFIYEYLKGRGISEDRLDYAGFGKSRPIFPDEETEEEAALNRRVEIRILSR